MRNILYRDVRSGGLHLVMRSSIEMIGNIDAFHSLLILGSWEIWRQGNPTHSSPERFTVNSAFHDNILMCECHVFLSDVSVELPFTLMHPKPLEESVYTDGKSQQSLLIIIIIDVTEHLWNFTGWHIIVRNRAVIKMITFSSEIKFYYCSYNLDLMSQF